MKKVRMLVCSVAVVLLACSCEVILSDEHHGGYRHGPPPPVVAHGHGHRHTYRYYPSSYVYFDIDRALYFHLDGDHWAVGVRLPDSIYIDLGEGVELFLDTDTPYVYFDAHRAAHPPHRWHGGPPPGPMPPPGHRPR